MLFQSYVFILMFFPICLAGFWMLSQRGKTALAQLWLIGFSIWFYAWANPVSLAVLAGSIAVNYGLCRKLGNAGKKADTGAETGKKIPADRRKLLLWAGIGFNAALLFYFKYFDFFVDNLNAVFRTDWTFSALLWPLGISFFTFQQIAYLVDVYREEETCCSLREYALFVSCFAYVSSGPIVTAGEMLPGYRAIGKERFDAEKFTRGLYLFTLGLAKKVLLADTFGKSVDFGYANVAALSGTDALLVMLFYTLQLYFDFSGYCDMGRGIAHMLGFELPVNFDSPYRSSNLVEFWRRWHITLNRFFLKYIYIPLGGSRRGNARTYANLFLIFLISGIWHGAGWNFIVWGALHGAVYVLTKAWLKYREGHKKGAAENVQAGCGRILSRTGHAAGVFGTFLFVNICWIFFRAANLSEAGEMLGRILKGGFGMPSAGVTAPFNLEEFWYVMKIFHLDRLAGSGMYLCAGITLTALGLVFFHKNAGEMEKKFKPGTWNMILTAGLFLWCVLSLGSVSSFVYFQF